MSPLSFADRWRIYETAVYVAWADGRLHSQEITAARAIAEELDLDGDLHAAGVVLRRGPPRLVDVGLDMLERSSALLAYGTAAWMSFVDGVEHPTERAALKALARWLAIPGEAGFLLEANALFMSMRGEASNLRTRYRAMRESLHDLLREEVTVRASSGGEVEGPE